ncbi:MAG: MBL fold metallo-hydrolase [Candidatus Poribacteria bacterium]|nr:MBL fold metallo-hydrolase [Candidatus Poribacteria bacterium]
MNYVFLGGAGEVGGSCMLLSVAGRYILFDCGIRVNRTGIDALPDLELLKQSAPALDAIFVSHAHADHVGALPLAHALYPNAPIYATVATQRLSSVMLTNAVRVMETEAEDTIFTQEAVETTLARIETLEMGEWIELWDGWRVQFIRSGHILGAVSIYLETPEGRFFYSGDVSTFHQKTIDGLDDIISLPAPDFMVCEATYGNGLHPSRTEEEGKLAKAVADVIKDGGSVLIPSFALGRAQEIILILRDAMISQNIPVFPVITDGLVNSICAVYENLTQYLGTKLQKNIENARQPVFFYKNFSRARLGEQEAILKNETPKCIIASSGMLTGGASVFYARGLAAHEKNAIFLSGYQDAESPGRKLQQLQSGDTLNFADGTAVGVKCRVERFHLSAHSDQGQLISVIKTINPKSIALVHGEEVALKALREKLINKYPVLCPYNKQVKSTTDFPMWVSPTARARMKKKETLNVGVQVNGDAIALDAQTPALPRWQEFAQGEHTATLKGDRLIIRKK